MSKEKTRITVFVADALAKEFTETMRSLGISGTAFLSRTLPAELDYLAKRPATSDRDAAVLRFYEAAIHTAGTSSERRRFNITLDREDAERMDQLCREKRVPRDLFMDCYLGFLVNGTEGVCEAPLKKVSEILMNPRHEYEEKRRNAPPADEDYWNLETSHSMVLKAFPEENPYSPRRMVCHALISFDDEQLDLLARLRKDNRTPEKR
jgi:hypothetical protein